MARRSVVNLVRLGKRAASLLYGSSLRPLHTSTCNTSSQPKCGFKPEKVAVVTKTTRYEFEQQRYRYAGLCEEDLKQLVRTAFPVQACPPGETNTWPDFVFCSLPWRAPVITACWRDTTSTPTMWSTLWSACGKMRPVTGTLSQPHSLEVRRSGLCFLGHHVKRFVL